MTDTFIPVIGQGTYKYNGGVEPLRYGIDLGATLIDTAEIYGTESVVGDALMGDNIDEYDDVFVSTKLWKTHVLVEDVISAKLNSACSIGRNPIDLYMLHFPMQHMSLSKIMRLFEYMKLRGYIRHIGVCNLTLIQLKKAQAALRDTRIEAVQYRYNLNRREVKKDILPYCRENNITFMAYEPLDQGRLAGKAKEALQFIVKEGCVAIVRSGNKDHIKANIEAVCEVSLC